MDFRYRVVRVWEKTAESVLAGPLGTLPLAPLADVATEALPGVIRRMQERIGREATPTNAGDLWAETFVLMGLRYPPDFTGQLLKGVRQMKESSTYQAILEEGMVEGMVRGKAEEARRLLLRLGAKRFGEPDAHTQATIEAIGSVERLEKLVERVLEAESWKELLK